MALHTRVLPELRIRKDGFVFVCFFLFLDHPEDVGSDSSCASCAVNVFNKVDHFGRHDLLNELSHVLTQCFTARPFALSMSIERVRASMLLMTAREKTQTEKSERSETDRTQFPLSPSNAHAQKLRRRNHLSLVSDSLASQERLGGQWSRAGVSYRSQANDGIDPATSEAHTLIP